MNFLIISTNTESRALPIDVATVGSSAFAVTLVCCVVVVIVLVCFVFLVVFTKGDQNQDGVLARFNELIVNLVRPRGRGRRPRRHVLTDLRAARTAASPTAPQPLDRLTARQLELLVLLASGRTNAGVAADLHFSEGNGEELPAR